jgi:transcription termination factor Rho
MDETLTSEERTDQAHGSAEGGVSAGQRGENIPSAADTASATGNSRTAAETGGAGERGAAETPTSGREQGAASTGPATAVRARALDLNELQNLSTEDLAGIADEFGLHLHPARSRHHHIADLVRAALGRGSVVTAAGFLDQASEAFGLLRSPHFNFLPLPEDPCVPRAIVQGFHLRPAQQIAGTLRLPRDRERGLVLDEVTSIEGEPADQWTEPSDFEKLTPQFPQGRIMLENPKTNSISARAVDLLAPLGRGQRGLIVAPPRVGKTILLKEIAKAIRVNHPEIVLILLLVDERPEEVTDLKREIDCQIYHSNFDESVHRHVQVAELTLERAKRLVELKKDVVILLDSLTRLSRGYNNLQPSKGRIMSGGVEAKALIKPKKFFGSARNVEEGGSLTILATALIETGSRMDELIFEEFKGTGNMELHLDRALQEKRLYPAIHVLQSATRREDLLYHPDEWERVQVLRKTMAALPPIEAMEKLIENLEATKTNAELLLSGLR